MVVVRELTVKDISNFELNQANINEIRATTDEDIGLILATLYDMSQEKYIVIVDGTPVCIFGLVKRNNGKEVWLFFSKHIEKLPLSFFKESKKWFKSQNNISGQIFLDNIFALEWAKFMGFKFDEPVGKFIRFSKGV